MTSIFNTKTNTRVGTWNVRTLFQCGRTDQVLKTMRDYRLDILGVSEMRWTGQGRLVIDGATVLYSGKQDHHTHGVGFILSSYAAQALVGWRPVNERIITARLCTRHAKVTIVQVYAPTEVTSEEEKDTFYTQLQGVLEEIPSYDIKLLIGDFNAQLDSDRRGLHTTVGPHGSASATNDNGERLLMLTSTNGLSIGNTFFKHKRIHKMTWVSPGGNTRSELDYICTSTRWRSSLVDVRSYRGADVGSDHYLVVGKIRLKLKRVQTVRPKRPYSVDKLKSDGTSESYGEELRKRLEVLHHSPDIEEQWGWFSRAISETAEAVLGRRRGSNKERWITERTWDLIDKRKMAKIRREQKRRLRRWRVEDEEYRRLDKEVKRNCRNDKRRWLEGKAREAQEAAEKNEMKTLYRIVRELTSSRSSSGVPIRSKDGRALLSSEEQEARWVEHFREVLNQPTPPTLFNLDQESPAPTLNITLDEITDIEVARAIKSLKNNKAPGLDEVSAELLKHGREVVVESLTHLFNLIWRSEDVPADWRRGVIVTLPKKGNLSDCNNWRGITLLSVPGKVFCSVLLQRLKSEVDNILREEQAGFRKGRSCSEQIFTLRNIIQQCIELQTTIIINYIDFKKAFDSVHCESLWQIVQLYGVPSKYVNIFRALYRNSTCRVRTSSGTTDDFDIVTGVRQGCILSPLLFLITIDFVMGKTLARTNFGVKWGQGRLTDLDFADDLALISHTHHELQEMTSNLHEHGGKVGLRISHEKTKAMIIGQGQHHPPLSLGQHDIEYVDNFTYLGSNISNTGNVEKDVQIRIGKAAGVFQRLRNIWSSNAITTTIKLRLYSSVVIPTVTYACETWTRTASITNRLDVFHRRCLRSILRISWRDHITNEEVMKRAGVALLSDMVSDRRRRMAGHVLRLPRERPASVAMDWVPEGGKRKRGRPKKTWRHTFKEDLSEMGVSWHGARRVASDRDRWRGLVAQCSSRNGRK